MSWLARAAGPFVKLLSASTQAVLKLLPIDLSLARGMTEEEIAHSLEEGVDAGVIEQHERQMVQNVFHLDDRPLTSMMVPRSDIEWLDASLHRRASACARSAGGGAHSWYPVCRGSLDDVVGVVSVAQLLALGREHSGHGRMRMAAPALFVPETLTGMELLEQFRQRVGPHGVRGRRIRRGAGPDDAARPAGGHHRRAAAGRAGAKPGRRSARMAPGCWMA